MKLTNAVLSLASLVVAAPGAVPETHFVELSLPGPHNYAAEEALDSRQLAYGHDPRVSQWTEETWAADVKKRCSETVGCTTAIAELIRGDGSDNNDDTFWDYFLYKGAPATAEDFYHTVSPDYAYQSVFVVSS